MIDARGYTPELARTGTRIERGVPSARRSMNMRTELARKLAASTAAGALGVLLIAAPALAQGQQRENRAGAQAGGEMRGGAQVRGGGDQGELRGSSRARVDAGARSNLRGEGNVRTRGDVNVRNRADVNLRNRGDVRVQSRRDARIRGTTDTNIRAGISTDRASRRAMTGVSAAIASATGRRSASASASPTRPMPMAMTTATTPTVPLSPMHVAVSATGTMPTVPRRAATAHRAVPTQQAGIGLARPQLGLFSLVGPPRAIRERNRAG